MATSGFTERVRQELSRVPEGDDGQRRAELAALLRGAGSLHVSGPSHALDHVGIGLTTTSGAVARRAFALLASQYHLHPELRVRAPAGVRRDTTYGVLVGTGADTVAVDLGLSLHGVATHGEIDPRLVPHRRDRVAYVRGAVLGGASISAPGRAPHLEIGVADLAYAQSLADLTQSLLGATVTTTHRGRPRVVIKSGATIGDLLATTGATQAFLEWDQARLRRAVRSDATRLANADAANVKRSVEAAAAQTRAVEHAVEQLGWDGIDEELRPVALARLANPAASLTELGELLDPPLSKATVHRRLARLFALAEDGGTRQDRGS